VYPRARRAVGAAASRASSDPTMWRITRRSARVGGRSLSILFVWGVDKSRARRTKWASASWHHMRTSDLKPWVRPFCFFYRPLTHVYDVYRYRLESFCHGLLFATRRRRPLLVRGGRRHEKIVPISNFTKAHGVVLINNCKTLLSWETPLLLLPLNNTFK